MNMKCHTNNGGTSPDRDCKRACPLCGQDAVFGLQPAGLDGCVRLGRSLRSLPRLIPPQFASLGLLRKPLIRAGKPSFTT